MVKQVMVIIDGPEPLDIYQFTFGIFLKFVPHGESALAGNIALDVDIILSLRKLIDPGADIMALDGLSCHLLVLLMHWLQQLLSHVR